MGDYELVEGAAGLADGLVRQYERDGDLGALADGVALYSGMEWRTVRGRLLDALRAEAEEVLREAGER